MNMSRLYCLVFVLCYSVFSIGQQKCFFEHYGTEDGLPQHTVMSIIQDHKGFMWFSTWNGLCRFDGYNFYTYRIQQGDKYHMRSNRIDYIYEDKYGYIWALPYDREPHRFDPHTETFMGIRSLKGYEDLTFLATKIILAPSGKVWLLSDDMGCVSVIDEAFNIELYNNENGRLNSDKVNYVYEDSELNSWILTGSGLYQLTKNGKFNSFFAEKSYIDSKPSHNFYAVMEAEDKLWFGADSGNVWVYDKRTGKFDLFQLNTQSDIRRISSINDSEIVMATRSDGFFVYNISSGHINKYDTSTLAGMTSNEILSCYIDKSDNIWFEQNQAGVSMFNLNTRIFKRFVMNTESVVSNVFPSNFFIFEDKENRLWVHPRGGGFAWYDANNDVLTPFFNEPNSPDWRFSNMMHTAFSDKQGNLWLSTRSHGLDKVIFNDEIFKTIIVDSNIHSTINNDVRSIFEDDTNRLWVSTKGGKVFVYDESLGKLGYLCDDGQIGYGDPLEGITYCMMQDNKKNIWIGTKGEGVYKLVKQGDRYKVEHYTHSPENPYSLSSNSVYAIFQDRKNQIWVGTYGGGLNLLDENRKRFINSRNELKSYPIQYGSQVRVINEDKYGNVCVGTTLGLVVFSPNFSELSSIDYKFYTRTPGDEKSLSENDVYDIYTTGKGQTYIATFGGGVNCIEETDESGFPTGFSSYTTKDGLPSDVILTLAEDTKGNLWITSEGNLTKFDTAKRSFETYSEINRQIEGQNFSEGAICVSRKGVVYVGYSKGLLLADPEKINKNTFTPYVAITKLQIANRDIQIGEDSPLKANIDDLKAIKLDHKQNFINIEFVALDYIEPRRVTYAYKLEGFDEDWIITSKQRIANYTNLSPGNYIFRVRSTNSDGVWVDNEHALKIEITPSFWQTGWAYLLYVVVIIVILYGLLRTLFIFYRLKDKVILEHEQTEMKTRFFTDISHEIRTPLTMIVAPVENIIENEKTPSDIKSQLQLVLKNSNRMLRMVNQILDFRKIQKTKLNIQETNIGDYVSDICTNFTKTAEYQNIKLSFNNLVADTRLWVDRDSVEKLVFNLLSNAFKYTAGEKAIEVNIFTNKKDYTVAIQVKDEGRGMTKDILNKLFTRFASFNKDKNKPSTGIGLSIVKEVVDRHHAKISVESEENTGSVFTVYFQQGIEHFKDDPNINYVYATKEGGLPKLEADKDGNTIQDKVSIEEETRIKEQEDDKQTILVVEDDTDLRHFIVTILEPYYSILEAVNGKDGYEKAKANVPDFILSDIMMPEMDGMELLKEIRKTSEISHIPVILLTAKTDVESRLDSFDSGADDYITKPFSVKLLKARIDNIIRQRKRLYDIYSNGALISEPTIDADTEEPVYKLTPQDEAFLVKIKEVIDENLDNSDFLVDDLANSVSMSRTVFFKKLKSLTGLSPIEFIRDIKIKAAAKLIASQKYTIKEVSFMIGISDTKYFSQCFKNVYGMTPSEYKSRNNKS